MKRSKKKDKTVSFLKITQKKILELSQWAVERDWTKHKIALKISLAKPRTIAHNYLCLWD